MASDIFAVPVSGNFLIYAPLHNVTAFVNRRALQQIQQGLQEKGEVATAIRPLLAQLTALPSPPPAPRSGPLQVPLFLGIIPTRGCNMGCRYCGFAAPKQTSPVMSLALARTAVDAYLRLLTAVGERQANIHFFGGEPFFAADVVHFVVNYARRRAASAGMSVHFEATTNGLYNSTRCQWIADHFHTVILSLDGPADVQNKHRPGANGQPLFEIVARSAKILSEGSAELILRACVTAVTVTRLPEIARWISAEFSPRAVCFESLTPSTLSASARFHPPDPWQFARYFDQAAQILAAAGIHTVMSTADTSTKQVTFCPVGQDALIVTPDGKVNACYLLEEEWQQQGLDLRLGQLEVGGQQFNLDTTAVQQIRQLTAQPLTRCAHCLCRYHCAGGCHVNHADGNGRYDDLCIQTRLITITGLLRQLGLHHVITAWHSDDRLLQQTAWQPDDRLQAHIG
ncbi:MAG TPA: radical SAM protein [Chloroflexota bacterium]|nr:radical SAM protein [Chloroflexota bacterium]